MKKVYKVHATKKNGQYLASAWVVEDAIEAFKADLEKYYTKTINYTIYDGRMVADENGNSTICAHTLEGIRYDFRVTDC